MTAGDILEHFLSRSDWVDRASTVDRIIAGDPDAEVDRCLVTWIPGLKALRLMVDNGVRLMICHEPTFWNHPDERPMNDAAVRDKLDFINDHGLVVLRNHDCWDKWPGVGIPWAWGAFLGLGTRPKCVSPDHYQHRYDIAPVTLDEFARGLAGRCRDLGEPLVQVTGNPAQMVSRIGTGTGCVCDINVYRKMDCDCSIVSDDGSCYWAGIQRASELDHPVIRVNHGTSEEPGMLTLTEYINTAFTGLHAEHMPHGSSFRLVGPV